MTDLLDRPTVEPTDLVDGDEEDTADRMRAHEIVGQLGLAEADANQLADELARAFTLGRDLGRFPGRTLIMEHLGVTDTRARKLIKLGKPAQAEDPRTPAAGPGRASGGNGVRSRAPAGDQLPPGTPAGAAPPHQPYTPTSDDTTPIERDQTPTSATTPPPAPPPGGEVVNTPPAASVPAADQEPAEASSPPTTRRSATPAVLMTFAGVAAAIAAHLVTPAHWTWVRIASAVLLGLALGASITLVVLRHRQVQNSDTATTKKVEGAGGYYMAAVLSMAMSIDTSWRFFRDVLGIQDIRERVIMFAVLEVALLACGWGMRANVKAEQSPGAPRLMAWLLCGFSGYMALYLSGPGLGLARVVLGPALGIAMIEFALGIERHAVSNTKRATTWGRVTRELRERALSLLGLADDERDARARTRDRAALRAARLAAGKAVLFRSARLRRALHKADVAHDPAAHDRMLAELAVIRHAKDLITLTQPSPWKTGESDQNRAGQN